MTRKSMSFMRLAVACLAAALCVGAAQGAVYDETTGYVRLLRSGGSASIFPLSTNQVFDADGTSYIWSDHLAIHAGTNYYANTWFRGWPRQSKDPAIVYPIPCNRFVLENGSINWKFGYPSVMVFENEGLFALGKSTILINQDSCLLGGIGGTITIQNTTAANPFTWQTSTSGYATLGHGYYVTAKVVGAADQIMRITTPSDASGRVYFMGDMSEYLGTINTISNIVYAGTSFATKAVNATKCGEVLTSGADGAEIFIPKVTLDATSAIGCAATNTLVVDTLTIADGSTVRGFFCDAGVGGCVTVTNVFTAPGKIRVTVDMPINGATNDITRLAVLRIAKTAGTVTQSQLELGERSSLAGVTPAMLPNVMGVEVEDDVDWTTVYVTWRQVVRQIKGNAGSANAGLFNTADLWSNNKTPAENAGLDFYSSTDLYIPITSGKTTYFTMSSFTFGGNIVTLNGAGTGVFSNIYATAGGTIRVWSGKNTHPTLQAPLTLLRKGSNRLLFVVGNSSALHVPGPISGDVGITVSIRKPDVIGNEVCTEFWPSGTNSDYSGTWLVRYANESRQYVNPTQYMKFAVCDQRNLGKPLPAFTYDALSVEEWQAVMPGVREVTLDDMTRGINLVGNAQLLTPEGRTLAIKSPLTLSGVVHKTGAGTLALGGTAKPKFCGSAQSVTPLAGTNGLIVAEGWITPISTNGVDGLAVEFAGGGIKLDRAPSDAGVAAYGFWNTKWSAPFARAEGVTAKVPVMVDMGELTEMPSPISRYAICTVAADKAAGVKGMLEVQKPFKGYVTGVEERANADGTVTLLAVVRYGGLTMFIR